VDESGTADAERSSRRHRPQTGYTTVLTTLIRLHEKGRLLRERRGRAYAYSPADDITAQAATQMRALMDRSGDREAVLANFVGGLDARDGVVLRRLVNAVLRHRSAR
jgi:predicted transcriptional regulator